MIPPISELLVEAAGLAPGARVLDAAAVGAAAQQLVELRQRRGTLPQLHGSDRMARWRPSSVDERPTGGVPPERVDAEERSATVGVVVVEAPIRAVVDDRRVTGSVNRAVAGEHLGA